MRCAQKVSLMGMDDEGGGLRLCGLETKKVEDLEDRQHISQMVRVVAHVLRWAVWCGSGG